MDGSRQGRAYHVIRQAILEAALPGGAPLSEYQLAADIGVSRTPVREALKRLQHEGLVRSIPRRGAFVSELTVGDIIEIYEVRDQLEVFAARLAAERMEAQQAKRLHTEVIELERLAARGQFGGVHQEDIHLHKSIIAAASNGRLAQILSILDDQVHRIRVMALSSATRIQGTLAEHRSIVDAIVASDPEAAERAMRLHLRAARENAIRLVLAGKSLGETQEL